MPIFNQKKTKAKTPSDSDSMTIGTPYMVQHHFHVGFDKITGEFNGLPDAWNLLLKGSDIS